MRCDSLELTIRDGEYQFVIKLTNDSDHDLKIDRYQYETEGLGGMGDIVPNVLIPANASRVLRRRVPDFHDIAIWIYGRRTDTVRTPRRGLFTITCYNAPMIHWKTRRPAQSVLSKMTTVQRDIFNADLLRDGVKGREVWPLTVQDYKEPAGSKYYVIAQTEARKLRLGHYYRCRGDVVEYYVGGKTKWKVCNSSSLKP
jgi:hypothetical protein